MSSPSFAPPFPLNRSFWLWPALFLAACGGGGGDTPASQPELPPQPQAVLLKPDCTGAACAAVNQNYSGSGIGVWAAENQQNQAAVVDVTLTGITNSNKVTLVLSNLSTQAQDLNAQTVVDTTTGASVPVQAVFAPSATSTQALSDRHPSLAVRQAKRTAALGSVRPSVALNQAVVGSTKDWLPNIGSQDPITPSTLRSQRLLSNGKHVNIWVQDSEWASDKVTQAMVDAFAEKFAQSRTGVFDMVTSLYGGQPWGPSNSPNDAKVLIGPDQDIQIVLVTMPLYSGYFSASNNYLQGVDPTSNEALAFFMSAGDAYNPSRGMNYSIPVLSHEFVHMINFYQRNVLLHSYFDDWLEEMSAMSLQEMAASILSPEDKMGWWHEQWLERGQYNCRLDKYNYNATCSTYDVAGSFNEYLLRQYGLSFQRDLYRAVDVPQHVAGIDALDVVIKKYDAQANLQQAFRRWGATIALLDSHALPAGYGYPERVEVVNGVTYTLKALNGSNYASLQKLPSTLPATLQPYAHAPLQFVNVAGRFHRQVTLPAHTALTVVVN